ncbi:CBS domain-containing protein, partial [candidate division KSB1 bacterium]|nr:CBS domain-containing protein [candidate division KSB1 bacterium]NIT73735.1 CBS domain-containing protein [candidate division KSB1 bacterium]NIX73415.1 CBS domain-containing protein [candidate division KSB1 bacterium]
IGAVLVRNSDGEISGLLSERDVLRQCHQNIDKLDDIQIKEVMTRDLIVGVPEDKAGYAEQIMVHNNIRHLPIVSDQRLEGIVSMRDIVQAELTDVKVENRYLRDYISNKYPA